jgi:uncharacterized protein with GYD domain
MPMYITYAKYSHSGVKGMIDKPTDRTGAIKALIEKSGGKLIAVYMTTGSHDVVIVSEAPAGTDVVAVGMAAAASGAVSKIETVRAWTPSEFKSIAEKAGKLAGDYTPPGNDQC